MSAVKKNKIRIGIVGNPNSGKTTLFNLLTGGSQKIGNWPGVTVEQKVGFFSCDHNTIVELVDLPGIYSLSTSSIDEQIARDYILTEDPDAIINIIDASNLERSLYLTVQLLEMKVPVIMALNMMDYTRQKNIKIDIAKLQELLGCPVICMVANKGIGIKELKEIIRRKEVFLRRPFIRVSFPKEIEEAISAIVSRLEDIDFKTSLDLRWVAVKLLEGDRKLFPIKDDKIAKIVQETNQKIQRLFGEETDIVIADSRYGFIHSVCKKVVDRSDIVRRSITDFLDRIVLNRFLGLPIFLMAMYLTFWIAVNFGGCFIDFFDILFGAVFVEGTSRLLSVLHAPVLLTTILAHGLGKGIQTVATFIPPIFFMFFCLALLEDSGYMARAAFIMERIMRFVGLPGKAFVPLLLGFGCNVPAIMATRTLENEKDRILTVVINPLMSCGARMPIYALFAAAFFPQSGGVIVFSLYMIGISFAAITAFIFRRTILKGEQAAFIMELPPYHVPTLKGLLVHTIMRVKSFVIKAGQVIVVVVLILSVLNTMGTDFTAGHENTKDSILSKIGLAITPVFRPMGITQDNWPATVGLFTGLFAKETVIGTLDAMYSQMRTNTEEVTTQKAFRLREGIKKAFESIPANLSQLRLPFSPAGLIGVDVKTSISQLEVRKSTYASLQKYFRNKISAFAYLLFILLYSPCLSAMAAVYRELNRNWMIFTVSYLTGSAWLLSTLFYQAATFSLHPRVSLMWILSVGIIYALFVSILRYEGNRVRS